MVQTTLRTNQTKFPAPGTSGNLMTSDGTNWNSTAPTGGSFNGANVTKSATATMTNGPTTVAWNTESFDTNSYHDNATNNSRLTVPSNGYYLITTTVLATSDISSGYIDATIKLNGTIVASSSGLANNVGDPAAQGVSCSTIQSMTTGQYVETVLYSNNLSGTVTYGQAGSNFCITRLG